MTFARWQKGKVSRMDDLISRQAAIDELNKGAWGVEWDKTLAKAMIESLPSADVAPVRHGRWIDKIYGCKECSECGYIWLDFGCPNYCPKCGARMDGEGDDTD